MAITNIAVNFTPCVPGPIDGYNIEYRVVGDALYIDAGNFMSSPANISVSYPDGTQFEGIVHSPCGDVIWSTVTIPDEGCGCRFGFPGEDELAGENRQFDVTSAYTFVFTGSSAITLQVNNSNGIPLYALSSGGSAAVVGENNSNSTGVAGYAQSGTAGYFQSNSGAALWAVTTTGFAAGTFFVNPATVDTIQNVVRLNRNTSGTADDGIGGSLEYYTEDDSGSIQLSTSLISKLTTAAAGTRVSEWSVTGVDNAVIQTLFVLSGNGQATLNKYGIGTFADTPVYGLGVLADGTIVEYDPGTGSGVGAVMRFGYPAEDTTAGEDREFDLTGAFNFNIVNGGNQLFEIIGSSGQIVLGQYGAGFFFDTPAYGLGVDAIGNVVEYDPSGLLMRFAYPGEDVVAGENRQFDVGEFTLLITTAEPSNIALNLTAPNGVGLSCSGGAGASFVGTAGVGIQSTSDSGDYGVDARSYSAADNANVYPALKILSYTGALPADVGFGTGINFEIVTDTAPHTRNSNRIVSRWAVQTEGSQSSEFYIAGVDNATDAILLSILGNGIFTLPLGLFDYANDAAAAAGTPVIPIGGLYRTGNAVQIRLT